MASRDAVFMSSIIFGVAATHRRHGSRARAGWKPSVRRCFLCFLTTFSVMLLLEMLLLPSGMLRGLPGSSAAPVSVNAIRRATQDALSALTSGGPNPRPAGLAALAALPNISVVMPCFGHVAFQEEAIASVVHQQYPPAEIIVVDDGSEDKCGEQAQHILSVTLAAPRRRQVEKLIKWWGFGTSELELFRDEVILTPNRGVAHARNTGIRRARGDWVCCLDADDMISPEYFLRAMELVAKSSGVNLVYANQQFFFESKWQWNVPELRVDDAIVHGPLPLMTLWKRCLWEATPHGFDEALPKGHEDWAFWLQLTRLPLQSRKINEFLTQYRFKTNSKMRNRERNNPEVPRLMRTLFADLYPVRKLLIDHYLLLQPKGFSESVQMDVSVSQHLHPHRSTPHLWVGMILQSKGDLKAACRAYNRSKQLSQPYDWQAAFRLWKALLLLGDAPRAALEEEGLRRLWGPVQLGWYATDVDGRVVPHAADLPLLRDESENESDQQ